ncbi:MAG: hypothetical protein ACYC1D_17025, partial [Acidimicrobiales bacterium]
ADASKGSVPKAAGEALASAASKLVAGARADQAAGRPLPKWTTLGENLIAAGEDVVAGNSTALGTDGTAAAKACQTIPAPARQAGGYAPASTAPPASTLPGP